MRCPAEWYQLRQVLAERFPQLRPAQRDGLSWWVGGASLAESGCQTAVVQALRPFGRVETIRQYLREWLYAGADRACRSRVNLDVTTCFAPLLRWVVSWWHGPSLPLALDATYLGDRWVVLTASVLYRGSAIPVGWQVVPANQEGAWTPHWLALLDQVVPAVPVDLPVLVLTDRGLWSPVLWQAIQQHSWHPLMRLRLATTFTPTNESRCAARELVPEPGTAWAGAGVAFKPGKQQPGTLLAGWEVGQDEPWLILTDLPPDQVDLAWYGLRMWIELGFRALKRFGWQWHKTRRNDADRIARHWLVLAVATLWAVATGTRIEDADAQGRDPAHVRTPPAARPHRPRRVSVFRLGLARLRWQLSHGGWWQRLWLVPEPLPVAADHLRLISHAST